MIKLVAISTSFFVFPVYTENRKEVFLMKIYVDVIFFLNFSFDFLLLFSVTLILKRKVRWIRLLLASLVGALSTFLLFFPMNTFLLFFFKVVVSIFMVLISFGKTSFLKNMGYLYFSSILLGGFLTFVNQQFSYKSEGLIFFTNGFSINVLVLLILSPIIFTFYYRQSRYFRNTLSNVHIVEIFYQEKSYSYQAYFDTGNSLVDPYKKRPVHLLFDRRLQENFDQFIMIPFSTLNSSGVVRGVVFDKMIVDGKLEILRPLIGFVSQEFNLDDASMILSGSTKL